MVKRWILIGSIIVAIARTIYISQILSSNLKIEDEPNGIPTLKDERPFCCDHPVIDYFDKLYPLDRPCFDILDKNGKPQYHVFYVRFKKCPFINFACKLQTLPMIVEANTSSLVAANLWCPLHADTKQYPRMLYASDILNGTFMNKTLPLFYGVFSNPIYNNSSSFSTCAFSIEDANKTFATSEVLTFRDDSVWEKSSKLELTKKNKIGILAKNLTSIGNVSTLEKKVKEASEKISSIAVRNSVQSMNGNFYDILYLSTASGQVLKGVAFQDNHHPFAYWSSVHLNKIDKSIINKTSEPVKLMVFMGNYSQEVPLATCEHFITCESCVEAQDPDCVWNKQNTKCEFFQFNATHDYIEELVQDVEHGDSKICAIGTTRPFGIGSSPKMGEITKSFEKELLPEIRNLKDELSEIKLQNEKLHDSLDRVMSWLVPTSIMFIFLMVLNLTYCVFVVCNWEKILTIWRDINRKNRARSSSNSATFNSPNDVTANTSIKEDDDQFTLIDRNEAKQL